MKGRTDLSRFEPPQDFPRAMFNNNNLLSMVK